MPLKPPFYISLYEQSLIYTLFIPFWTLHSVSSEIFCQFYLLIRFSICIHSLHNRPILFLFLWLFLVFLWSSDRSISSIECRVTCVDSSWWDCSKKNSVRGSAVCSVMFYVGVVLTRRGKRWKVVGCYVMASVINRCWKNRELSVLESGPVFKRCVVAWKIEERIVF